MSGRSWIAATAEQRVELRGLAGSSDREESDRARAILLSLEGWTSLNLEASVRSRGTGVGRRGDRDLIEDPMGSG